MSWSAGNEITASKLNSENNLVVHTISIGNNIATTVTKTCYIHKPASSSQIISISYMTSLDGWWGHASDHYVKMYSSNSSGSTGALLVSASWTSYQDHITYNIVGSQIPASGWYKFSIQQTNDWGGESISMQIRSYPMAAKAQHQLVRFSSTGSRIYNSQLSAATLNAHYVTTL